MGKDAGVRWWVRRVAVLGATLALIGGLSGQALADHEPVVDLDLGSQYAANFDEDAGGVTAVTPPPSAPPKNPSWAHGTPTSGPGVAFSGTKVWATNLAGNYNNSECSAIVSPPIDLTTATSASVSFMQWRHIEESTSLTSFAFDAGMLFVTTNGGNSYQLINPGGGYTSKQVGSTARTCLAAQPTGAKGLSGPAGTTVPPATYSPVSADLTAFAGQTVQFAIAFGSDSVTSRAGWYIDDFTVTTNAGSTVQDFENSDGGFTIKATSAPLTPLGWSHGTATAGPAATTPLWGTNLSGNYGQNECSSIETTPIDLRPQGLDSDPTGTLKATLSWDQFFRSSSSGGAGVVQVGVDGVYTNVVPTTGYGTTNPAAALNACLQDDTQASGGFAGLINAVGDQLAPQRADLTPFIGKVVTVRYLFASTDSTLRYDGWFVDNIAVGMKSYVGIPHAPDVQPPRYFADGWTTGGTTSWARGVATTGPYKGGEVFATNPAGNYSANECGYLDTPDVNGATLAAVPTMVFEHWYKIESATATGSAWDGGVLLASTDGGATWLPLTLPEYDRPAYSTGLKNCLAANGVPTTSSVFSGAPTAPETVTVDLSALAGAASVKIRFLFGSEGSVHYDGWYLRSVVLAGVPLEL
ncbi:MAG TPA: hypothetical protein VNE62_00570 [Actinomycetota bacterium]|nr:hypothetical protein [Actinomycetota bacterium]